MTAPAFVTQHRPQRRTGASRAPLRRVTAALAVLTGVAVPAGAAAAAPDDPSQGGLWYVDAMQLDEVHAQATGADVTVAVIDSPVNPDVADLAGTDLTVSDENFCQPGAPVTGTDDRASHGTNMAARIVGTGAGIADQPGIRGVAPDARVLYYTVGAEGETCEGTLFTEAVGRAIDDGADVISMSTAVGFRPALAEALAEAQRAGVVLVAAVANEGTLTPDDWPTYANGVVTVEAGDVTATVQPPA